MHIQSIVWLALGSAAPAVLAASTTTVTLSRSCPNPASSKSGLSGGPGGNSAGAGMNSGSVGSSSCTTTDCAPAASSIPNCASACLAEVASTFECDTDDYGCACSYQPYYAEGAESCISSACPTSSYVAVASAVSGLCSCESASSSDLACIASYSAGATGQSQSGGSPASNSNAATSSNSGAAATSGGQSAASTSSSSNIAAATTTSGSGAAASTSSNSGAAATTTAYISPVSGPNDLYGSCPYTTTITDSDNNVRTIPATVVASGPDSAPTATATYTYIGCFVDFNGGRVVSGDGYEGSGPGVDSCLDYCVGQGAEFAAVAQFGECLCSNNINEQNGCAHRCTDVCDDQPDALCGGNDAAMVYATVLT